MKLKPFWYYYGGKYQIALHYPKPRHDTIIEPFAGAAGYSLRYYDREIILIEKNPVVASIWRFLIDASAEDILSIPLVTKIYDLPKGIAPGAQALVGFCLNYASTTPSNFLSSGSKRNIDLGYKTQGWGEGRRKLVADQVRYIKHWKIIEGDYSVAEPIEATWFIDPPYDQKRQRYPYAGIDYAKLGQWCQGRTGQVIVCEQHQSNWLPFKPFRTAYGMMKYREVVWISE